MRRFLIVFLTSLLSALPAHADIVIGLSGPLTGQYAVAGEQLRHGARQAITDINAQGGVNGEKLILREADDACDPKQAITAANQMISEGIKYVVGHWCSGCSIPASKVYMDEGVLMVSPGSSNSRLTEESKDLVLRIGIRDNLQGSGAGNYLLKHYRGKNIAVIHDQSAYGRGVADEVKKTLNAGGVQETLFESYTPGQKDYSSLISRLKQAGISAAFVGGYHTEIGMLSRQLKEQGAVIQLIAGAALVTDEFWSIAGPMGEGLMMVFGPDPRSIPEAKTALAELRKAGFEPEGFTMYAYAAVQTIAEGLRRTGKSDPLKAAAAIRKAPVKTVLGPLTFDAKGDIKDFKVRMYRWHAGEYAEISE